jgi:hypothetical protein
LLWSAVASPIPKARDYAGFQVGLQQGFAPGEMGLNDKFTLQKILNGPCPLSSAPAAYAERAPGAHKSDEDLDHAIRQIISKAVVSDQVIELLLPV